MVLGAVDKYVVEYQRGVASLESSVALDHLDDGGGEDAEPGAGGGVEGTDGARGSGGAVERVTDVVEDKPLRLGLLHGSGGVIQSIGLNMLNALIFSRLST